MDPGSRWIDLKILNKEVVCTSAGSEGLIDHWEVHDVIPRRESNKVILKVRYLTDRFPNGSRAGKLGMIILNHNSEMKLESIQFFISESGYSGEGEMLYTYRFDQKIPN